MNWRLRDLLALLIYMLAALVVGGGAICCIEIARGNGPFDWIPPFHGPSADSSGGSSSFLLSPAARADTSPRSVSLLLPGRLGFARVRREAFA